MAHGQQMAVSDVVCFRFDQYVNTGLLERVINVLMLFHVAGQWLDGQEYRVQNIDVPSIPWPL